MTNIYISNRRAFKDDFFTTHLMEVLEYSGYHIINKYDEYSLEKEEIQYEINQCEIFVCILGYQTDPLGFFEIGYASALSKEILIITQYDDEVPYFLKKYQFINLDYKNTDSIYQVISYLNEISFPFTKSIISPSNLRHLLDDYKHNPSIIDQIKERDFAALIFQQFEILKYQPSIPTNSTSEYGYDMILKNFNNHNKTLVEIKKYTYNSKVSINVIQQLVGALTTSKADAGLIVTTSTFTNSARDFSESITPKIYLWDITYLLKEFST